MVTVRLGKPADLDAFVRGTMGNAWETEQIRLDEATVRSGEAKLLADPGKACASSPRRRAPPSARAT